MLGTLFSFVLLHALALASSVADARRLHRRACTFTWPAIDGDTCATMSRDWALGAGIFQTMNPGVDCAKLEPGKEYCIEWEGALPSAPAVTSAPSATPAPVPTSAPVITKPSSTTLMTTTSVAPPGGPAAPSPVQEGIAANCQKWYLVSGGDNCQKIIDAYKTFTLAQFYQWNPAVGTGCGALWPGYFVCVGVPGTPTAPPSVTTTTVQAPAIPTPTGPPKPCRWNPSKGQYDCPGVWPAAPGPIQEGVPYNCVKWVLQKTGVFCADMAKAGGIALDDFYSLNPSVGKNCGGLWSGYAYCLATGY